MQNESKQALSTILHNRVINLNTLSFDLPDSINLKIHSTYIKQGLPSKDKSNWNTINHNSFSTKTAYDLISNLHKAPEETKDYSWVWKVPTLNKIKAFLWLVVHNTLPTTLMLSRRNISDTDICSICYKEKKDIEHIFFRCTYSK